MHSTFACERSGKTRATAPLSRSVAGWTVDRARFVRTEAAMNRHGWARSLALTGGLLALTSVAAAGGDEKSGQGSKERDSSSAASSPAKSENVAKGSPQIEAAQRKLAAQKMYT